MVEEYVKNWRLLQVSGAAFYREARQAFNESHDPHLFFFLLRTCRNGLVRFNRDGEFNSGFHGARPGMDPETVRLIVEDWGRRLSSKDVRFSVRDYRQVTTKRVTSCTSIRRTKTRDGHYYSGMFDLDEFFDWLRKQKLRLPALAQRAPGRRGPHRPRADRPLRRTSPDRQRSQPLRATQRRRRPACPGQPSLGGMKFLRVEPVRTGRPANSYPRQRSVPDQQEGPNREEGARENLTTQVLARLDAHHLPIWCCGSLRTPIKVGSPRKT